MRKIKKILREGGRYKRKALRDREKSELRPTTPTLTKRMYVFLSRVINDHYHYRLVHKKAKKHV